MRLTATQLVTQHTCPFLRYVSYEVRQPLPVMGTRRRFGNVLHAALAAYESNGRSLHHAGEVIHGPHPGMPPEDLLEAGRIVFRRHEHRREPREGRPFLVEGSLRTQIGDHRLDVRVDRLDFVQGEFRLVE